MSDQAELLVVHIQALRILARTEYVAVRECRDLESIFNQLPGELLWRRDSGQTIIQTENSSAYFQETVDAIVADGRAASLTLAFKVKELVSASVRELNLGNLAASAVCVRAALEAAVASINLFIKFLNAHRHLASNNPWGFLVSIDEQAEKLTVGGKWEFASRQPTNILTSMNAVSNYLGAESEFGGSLQSIYTALSEVSHPNSAGSNLYWKHDLATPPVAAAPVYVQVKEKYGIDYDYHLILMEAILWAMGFSSRFSVEMFRELQEMRFRVVS